VQRDETAEHESVCGIIPGVLQRKRAATGIKKHLVQGHRIGAAEFRDTGFRDADFYGAAFEVARLSVTSPRDGSARERGIHGCRERFGQIQADKPKGLDVN